MFTLVTDLAKTEQQRQMLDLHLSTQQIARPFATPPGVPARGGAFARGSMRMIKDPDFIAAAKAQQIELSPVGGEEQIQRRNAGAQLRTPQSPLSASCVTSIIGASVRRLSSK